MDYFGLDDAVAALQLEVSDPAGAPLRQLLTLAWYLRQRQPRRSEALAGVAAARLAQMPAGSADLRDTARLELIEAEQLRLAGQREQAREHAARVESRCREGGDALGLGDALMLQAQSGHFGPRNREQVVAALAA